LSAQERLASCDSKVVVAAAKEIVNRPDTFKEPFELFSVAAALFQHGKKDAAVFWFYAAQLRVRYQLVFEPGDKDRLMAIMLMTIGPRSTTMHSKMFQTLIGFWIGCWRGIESMLKRTEVMPHRYTSVRSEDGYCNSRGRLNLDRDSDSLSLGLLATPRRPVDPIPPSLRRIFLGNRRMLQLISVDLAVERAKASLSADHRVLENPRHD